jgi:dihydroorotase
VSHAGIYGFSTDVHVGESEDMRLMDPRGAVRIAAEFPEQVIGIKVRVGRHASGDQGIAPLDVALQTAEEAGIPLMAHID